MRRLEKGRLLLALAAGVATSAVFAASASATPIVPPVTFCINAQTITFSDTTNVIALSTSIGTQFLTGDPASISFLTSKATTTHLITFIDPISSQSTTVSIFSGACASASIPPGIPHAWLCNAFGGMFLVAKDEEKAALASPGNKPANYIKGATAGPVAALTHDSTGKVLTPGYLSCAVPTGATPITGSDGKQLIADNEGDLAPASLFNSETLIYPAFQAA
jgi:hypothetical protein